MQKFALFALKFIAPCPPWQPRAHKTCAHRILDLKLWNKRRRRKSAISCAGLLCERDVGAPPAQRA